MELADRYAAAERLLPTRTSQLVKRATVLPQWEEGRDAFRYVVDGSDGPEHFEVDCSSFERRSAAPIERGFPPHEVPSPDGKAAAFLRNDDVWVRDVTSGEQRQLTFDGSPDKPYGRSPDQSDSREFLARFGVQAPPLVVWSPDSTRLLTHKIDQSEVELMHLVRASPPGGDRPKLRSYRYAMVGDEHVASAQLLVLDTTDGSRVDIPRTFLTPYLSPLAGRHAWWSGDARTIYCVDSGRNSSRVELLAIDAADGAARTLVAEEGTSQVQVAPLFTDLNVHVLTTGEVVWWSERTGWGHLYVYSPGGSCRSLTDGDWLVRDLTAVDEEQRVVWFTGAGREPGSDPYVRQIYQVALDGGAIIRVTDDDLDHELAASPSQRYAVDVACSLGTPPVTTLRRVGHPESLELERADASGLVSAGWRPPERFEAVAADGVTPIYGLLHHPQDFDPARKYPVLDDIYPGPQMNAAAIRFPGAGYTPAAHAAAMSALGFAVVVVDARGTPLRDKAFQDATRAGRDLLIEDHVAAIQQLGETRPWLDLDRVGIYGFSGGGQMSTRAMLVRPDFYKVAVSIAGSHDDACYHAMWGERFFGTPTTFDYGAASNAALADRLEGKLLLMHGDIDDNVTPHLTIRLVDAFMAADKDVDLLLVPNADHAMLTHQAHWIRRRWDYFVRHLMGVEPPEYHLTPVPLDSTLLEELLS